MSVYLLYRVNETDRNIHGAHAAIVTAADEAAAKVAAPSLVQGAQSDYFEGFTAVVVASAFDAGFTTLLNGRPGVYFEGDCPTLRGLTRGGSPAV